MKTLFVVSGIILVVSIITLVVLLYYLTKSEEKLEDYMKELDDE